MSELTNLLNPLYNICENLDRGIKKFERAGTERLKRIKIPSYEQVKSFAKENPLLLAAVASASVGLGIGVPSAYHHYVVDVPPTYYFYSLENNISALLGYATGLLFLGHAIVKNRQLVNLGKKNRIKTDQ